MEKYFNSIPGTDNKLKAERVLELNAAHPVFETLVKTYASDKEKAAKYAKLLYFQALLYAGAELSDPAEYAELISSLMV
jgi:molecular chaperone HtpG